MVYAGNNSATYHVRFTYLFEFANKKWKWATAQHTYLQNTEDPKEVYKQWVAEYNKDTKAFLLDKCPDDLRGTNNGGAFYGNSGFKTMPEGQKAYLEPSDMKSFQSGNLAVVMGIFTRPKKQADGTEKMGKEVFTAVMQKRNEKWLYVGHHATDMKE
jgi:ketosteroid isomerase-like protein